MPGPAPRHNDPEALIELLRLIAAADYAESRKWLQAAKDLRAGKYTAAAAAQTLSVSQATLYRQIQAWNAHLDAGPGVGP